MTGFPVFDGDDQSFSATPLEIALGIALGMASELVKTELEAADTPDRATVDAHILSRLQQLMIDVAEKTRGDPQQSEIRTHLVGILGAYLTHQYPNLF